MCPLVCPFICASICWLIGWWLCCMFARFVAWLGCASLNCMVALLCCAGCSLHMWVFAGAHWFVLWFSVFVCCGRCACQTDGFVHYLRGLHIISLLPTLLPTYLACALLLAYLIEFAVLVCLWVASEMLSLVRISICLVFCVCVFALRVPRRKPG